MTLMEHALWQVQSPAIMTGQAYAHSARIAEVIGSFPGYHDARANGVPDPVAKDNVEPMLGGYPVTPGVL